MTRSRHGEGRRSIILERALRGAAYTSERCSRRLSSSWHWSGARSPRTSSRRASRGSAVASNVVRIAGIRLQPEVARLLAEILEQEGFPETAATIAHAIELEVTVEAPLTAADYEAVLEALGENCPSTLSRLRRRLLADQRYVRRVTGG